MRRAGFVAILPALLLAGAAESQQPITLTPAQVGEIFCLSRLGNDPQAISGLLTGELTEAIATAERLDTAWAEANPGEKPPLGDGIPWQSWPDYAPNCTVGDTTLMMDEASVRISYDFPDTPQADYSDRLKLRLVEVDGGFAKVWRIDDVAYGTDGTLRAILASAFLPN
jgi:hypothetical protein